MPRRLPEHPGDCLKDPETANGRTGRAIRLDLPRQEINRMGEGQGARLACSGGGLIAGRLRNPAVKGHDADRRDPVRQKAEI